MASDRTHYEMMLDIDYDIELHHRHAQMYRHISGLMTFAVLVFSALAAILANSHPAISAGMAVSIIVITMLNITIKPETKAAQHGDIKRQWLTLSSKATLMKPAELDSAIRTLETIEFHKIRALELPAFNTNLQRHGHEDKCRKLGTLEAIAKAIS